MEYNKYFPPHHWQAIRHAIINDAVRHTLEIAPLHKFKAMRQDIFDNADLRLVRDSAKNLPRQTLNWHSGKYNWRGIQLIIHVKV